VLEAAVVVLLTLATTAALAVGLAAWLYRRIVRAIIGR
jgi:hypothetical protein